MPVAPPLNSINSSHEDRCSRSRGANCVRLSVSGFHTAEAALATVVLACGPVNLHSNTTPQPPTCRAVEPDFLVSARGGSFGVGLGTVDFHEWVLSGW